MKQIVQNLKDGKIVVVEVPMPSIKDKFVLVENAYSLISAGTEKTTVDFGKSSLFKKALQRPDLVKQVINNLKKEGLNTTFNKVSNRLEALTALGYSSAGIVKSSFDNNNEFKKGDRVACAGQNYASHAEYVNVPQNLVVKIPNNVSFEDASFTTLGAIALQGVRQADPRLGENVCVIGGGLLGQITCQLLNANGCNVVAIDLSDKMVKMINKFKFATAINRKSDNIIDFCKNFTNGYGFDKVIITAKAPSNDPIVLSSEILKKKGEIVIVGEVPMDVPRDPFFYKNELGLKISCSYGPGRYDPSYEEEGNDYPYGYVRWTEKRNMEAFLNLVSKGAVSLKPLITNIFDLRDAEEAYKMVLDGKDKNFVGVLIKYSDNKSEKTFIEHKKNRIDVINIGFIGAGNYAQGHLIPAAKIGGSLDTVVTNTGTTALSVSKKFGFSSFSTKSEDLLNNDKINTVFIATRHNSHSKYVIEALKKNKNIFVEKPLALNYKELNDIEKVYRKNNKNILTVGFNRRFSNSSKIVKDIIKDVKSPLVMNFRVNAGFIPKDNWIQTKSGGGRIIGEMCHFIDLMQFFTDSKPSKVFAEHISTSDQSIKPDDNISIVIKFLDGSIGNLLYVASGDSKLPKEHLEVFGGGMTAVIKDFQSVEVYKNNNKKIFSSTGKGQKECVESFLHCIKNNIDDSPITFESFYLTTLCTFKIIDSIIVGTPQIIDLKNES